LAGLVLRSRDPDFTEALADTTDEDRIRKVARGDREALAKSCASCTRRRPRAGTHLDRRAQSPREPCADEIGASVKADAARTLFTVDCSQIVWAVIDSGIEAGHAAFLDKDGRPRVRKSFDFTQIARSSAWTI
jgi:hypothetical protein